LTVAAFIGAANGATIGLWLKRRQTKRSIPEQVT
jgi:hypothetical protein